MYRSYRGQPLPSLDLHRSSPGCREFPQKCRQRTTVCHRILANWHSTSANTCYISRLRSSTDWHWFCFTSCVRKDCEAANGRLCDVGSCRRAGFPVRFWSSRDGYEARTGRNKKRLGRLCWRWYLQFAQFVLARNFRGGRSRRNPTRTLSSKLFAAPSAFLYSLLRCSSLLLGSIANLSAMPHVGFFAIRSARG
jgi:hypothetical protein